MYPITNEIKALFETEQRKVLRITGTDKNGAVISITDNDVIADSFHVDRYSCNGEKLEVGTAIAAQMSLTLENGGGQYNGIVFEGAELFVEVGIADWTQSSPTITYVPCGYFTPDEQPRRLSTISITGLDRMTKFDVVVDAADLTFPATIAGLVGQVCTLCGVTLAQSISGLVNAGVNVAELPTAQEEITYRNLIQWCAGVMGTNAWFDWNGQLRFSWYANVTGYVSTVDNRYSSDLYEDDLTVSGVEYTNDSGIVIVEGTDDYAIDLTGNAIAGPLVATVLPPLNTALNGFTYRPFTAATVNAPYLWPMDIVTFTDKDGNNHTSALTNVAFGLNGTTAMESKGMTYAINKLAQPKGFTREQAQLVSQAMEHVEQDIDDSLTQQEIFNRLTDNGAAQGLLLYNGQLYINASYINAGYLSADHIQGGTLTLGGQGNQNGVLQVLDASGNVITVLNNAGADITNGSLTTYSTDRLTRTILAEGLLIFQFYNSAAQPIGWRNALRLAADSQSATIDTSAVLEISGRGMVRIKNREGTTDPDYAEIDMDHDSVLLTATRNDSGIVEWASLNVTKDGVIVWKQDIIGDPYVLFELAAGRSSKPLSIGNGGTGATTAADARTNLGITPANIGAVATSGNQEIDGQLRVNARAKVKMGNTPYHYGFVQFDDIEDGVPEAISLIGFGGNHDFEVRAKKTNGGEEGYVFPAPTIDSGYARYSVLTSKSPVTVQQGGTGATTPDGACANIGAVKKSGDTMTGPLTVPNMVVKSGSWQFYSMQDANGADVGHVRGDEAAHHIAFREITPGTNGAYEDYYLPNPTIQSGDAYYSILTTKSAVGVPQGGTGATTPAQARANLEITPANIGAVDADALTIKPWGVNGESILANNGIYARSYNSSILPSQGAPTGFSEYASALSITGSEYPIVAYIDVFGNLAIWNSVENRWETYHRGDYVYGIAEGGTGATDPAGARTNLGIATTVTTVTTTGITSHGNWISDLEPNKVVIDAAYCTAGTVAVTPYYYSGGKWAFHCIDVSTGAAYGTAFDITIRYHNIY